MQIAMVGLGRMGGNMARRLLRGGHAVVGFATEPATVQRLVDDGGQGAATLDELVKQLDKPRVAWLMVPAGAATEQVVSDLAKRMEPGDTIVDGGNSFFKDDIRRMKQLRPLGLHYVDVGTSGGIWGLERDYCLMIGGEPDVVRRLDPIFRTLALPGSVPFILAGLRLGVGHALIGVVVGELVAAQAGVGLMMARAGATFQTSKVFAGLIIVAGTGIILTGILQRIERRFQAWKPQHNA